MEEEIKKKNLTKYYIFCLFACFNIQNRFKNAEKESEKKTPPKSHHYFGSVVVARGGVQNGYFSNVVRDLGTFGEL